MDFNSRESSRPYQSDFSCVSRGKQSGGYGFLLPSGQHSKGFLDDDNTFSEDDSSDMDSLWSGSTPSSWTSGSSMSEFRSSELCLSSLPTQKEIHIQSFPGFQGFDIIHQGDLPLHGETQSKMPVPTTFQRRPTLPPFQPKKNPSTRPSPRHHVDYLSHQWTSDDVSASWRFISSNKGKYQDGTRLENALWRGWGKWRSNLETATPESLNW